MSRSNCSRVLCQALAECGYQPVEGRKERTWKRGDTKVVVGNWQATSYVSGVPTQCLDFHSVSNRLQLQAFIANIKTKGI